MPEIVTVPLSDLIVDLRNARLKDEQPTEQAALLALAKQQGTRLLKLAGDIVERGVDPTALPAIVPTSDQKKRYTVVEGNRRITALKALETPSLIAPAYKAADQKRLNKLAAQFARNPITMIRCVLFDSEDEAIHWVKLRHTGQNEGVGLVEWGSEEQDRFASRYGQVSPQGQILQFVEKHGQLSEAASASTKPIITNLKRLISDPAVREKLGIEIVDGQVQSWFPTDEVAKGLSRIIEDLKTEAIKVGDIYYKADRAGYIEKLSEHDLPDPTRRLAAPQALDATTPVSPKSAPKKKHPRPRRKTEAERTAVIPKTCRLEIAPPRINQIYNELLNLSAEQFTNACSVTLRVFTELSVDHYIEKERVMDDTTRRNTPLAKRLKTVAAHMRKNGRISEQLETAVQRIADNQFVLGASMITFNQYVHNQYVFPKAPELRLAWNELQPFMECLWP